MAITFFDEKHYLNSAETARLLRMSVQQLGNLVKCGVIIPKVVNRARQFDVYETVGQYLEHLQKKGKYVGDMEAEDDEKRRLKADADLREAKAAIEGMKRDELKGRLHSSEDVKAVTAALVSEARGALLALPGKCAVNAANAETPREAAGVIKSVVLETLEGLKRFQYDPNEYKKRVRKREEWMNETFEEET